MAKPDPVPATPRCRADPKCSGLRIQNALRESVRMASGIQAWSLGFPERGRTCDDGLRSLHSQGRDILSMLQDLRYFARQTLHHPGFVITAVLSLALGIGATTTVFSVIYAGLMHPFPYRDAERIVRLIVRTRAVPFQGIQLNGQQIQQLRQLPIVQTVLAMEFRPDSLTGNDVPENVWVVALISNGFSDLGVPPVLGRGLLPSDALDGQDPQTVAVLSYKFWRGHFLSSRDVLGKTMEIGHKQYTIVGVAAPRFTWYNGDVFVPLKLTQDPARMYIVNLRLRQGVTLSAADATLQSLLQEFAKVNPKQFPEGFQVQVEELNEVVARNLEGTLQLLFGAVVLLLAIGCGNVSILLLARGTARQHELAVRAAVGAQRSRILRQLLTESILLAVIGAGLGILMAYGMLAGIRALLPTFAFLPEVVIGINFEMLVFCVGVALASVLVFGLWPAWQLSRAPMGRMIQSNTRRLAGTVSGRRTHNVLIAVQIALTLLLLAGAGSAMAGFSRLMHTPLGYNPHNVMSVMIPIHQDSYSTFAERAFYFEEMRAKVAEVPGVTMAAISSNATPPNSGWDMPIEILGGPVTNDQKVSVNFISPEYFAELQIPFLQGEPWNAAQVRNGAHLAIVNRTLARRYFPNGDAIGHSVRAAQIEGRPPDVLSIPNAGTTWLQIVGVVQDVRDEGLREAISPAVYLPYTLNMQRFTQILVRSNAPPMRLLHAVRQQLAAVNPEQAPLSPVRDLETWISDQPEWAQEHLAAWIFGVLAWLALALAALGLYSVVSYTVAQRTGEFGIRAALGAQRRDMMKIAFASTLASVGAGIFVGVVLIVAMNSVLARWVANNSRNPGIVLAGIALLGLAAMIACAIPARRASDVDPMTALRCE
jgi:predicted permease